MGKYKDRYRTQSLRLKSWDYGWSGDYFITLCADKRENFFGEIVADKMRLSPMGVIANILWYEIKNHAKNVGLGEFVVMPNHVHGILMLNGNASVETRHALSLQSQQSQRITEVPRFQNQGKNTISSIVGGYKSAVKKHANRLSFSFKWQDNYWEHIIRNENECQRISKYIVDNPKKWALDRLNGGVGNHVMEPSVG